ncbi:MAG TPA: FkbM family methyltransferase [Stellaceae bacterium]|nr:FkbM family methyltransferase [Stellaceae bacterium]
MNDDLANKLEAIERRLAMIERLATEIRGLVGPFGALLPDGRMLVQTLHGIKLYIDPLDLIMAPNLIVYRQWEADVTALLLNALDRDTVFVDVGANIGYFTCLAGSIIGTQGRGRVIAIEPNPACLALLDANLIVNWSMCDIAVHRLAAANFTGSAKLSIPSRRAPNAHLQLDGTAADGEVCEVPVTTLDNLLPPDLAVDFMKIDVEGHEWSVLDGARSVIERSPRLHILIEWSPGQMAAAGVASRTMIELFRDLGLVAYPLPNALSQLAEEGVPLNANQLGATHYGNILLARPAAA